jgi:hypothetical protein
MEPSEEIRRIIDRLTTAIAEGDSESVLGRLSDHTGTLIVGSDPAEWWRGHETRAVWGRQLEEFDGSFLVTANEIDAWEEGSVGWASVKEAIEWAGKTIEGRASYILHLEHDEWKVVHVHWSFPQPHIDVLGRSLTVTIGELEQRVQREKPDLSRALDSDGTITIALTDIVDSTVLLTRLGDDVWVDLLGRHTTRSSNNAPRPTAARLWRRKATGRCSRSRVHSARQSTTRRASRVKRSAAKFWCRASSMTSSPVPALNFRESREVELKGLNGRHRLYALDFT